MVCLKKENVPSERERKIVKGQKKRERNQVQNYRNNYREKGNSC